MPSANETVAIDNLTAALTGTPAAIDALAVAMNLIAVALAAFEIARFFELALLIGMLWLAFTRKDLVLHTISGLITGFIALLWFDDYTGISFALVALSAYQFIWQALIPALQSAGPSRGLSQFKGFINRVKGSFTRE